jgi:hypothetical protein
MADDDWSPKAMIAGPPYQRAQPHAFATALECKRDFAPQQIQRFLDTTTHEQ